MSLFTIQEAQPQHLAALGSLEQEHWDDETRPAPPPGSAFGARNPLADTLVAVDEAGEILGYAVIGRRTPFASNAHVAWLRSVAVHRQARRRGVGRALVAAALERARQRGAEQLGLTVLGSNTPAIGLYVRLGFEEVGRLPGQFCIGGSAVDDVFMVCWLDRS